MAQSSSTGIKDFVKRQLTSYYRNFEIKLANQPNSGDKLAAIKIVNGDVYVNDLGGYAGLGIIENTSTLLLVIKAIGLNHGTIVNAGANIQVDTNETTSTVSALGYVYNKDTSSFAEGYENTANGNYSHAEGNHTKTTNGSEHAEGIYNQSHEGKTIHSIGIGENEQTRKNAFEVIQDGSIYVYGLGNYDGSTLTNASTLLDICNSKANKIINAIAGNLASLDSHGNLQDSGKKPNDFADANHAHSIIKYGEYGSAQAQIGTQVIIGDGGRAYVTVSKYINGAAQLKQAFIHYDNIDNLNRALETPETPTQGSDKLSTSGEIYDALHNTLLLITNQFENVIISLMNRIRALEGTQITETIYTLGTPQSFSRVDTGDEVIEYGSNVLANVNELYNIAELGSFVRMVVNLAPQGKEEEISRILINTIVINKTSNTLILADNLLNENFDGYGVSITLIK